MTATLHYELSQYKNAFLYYMKADDVNFCKYQEDCSNSYSIGLMYHLGKGVRQNKTKAYKFYLEADKKGLFSAQNNLDILCKESPWACK